MCFFGIASCDPAIHLCFGDFKVDNYRYEHPQFLEVRIKASKTDPFRLGISVYLGITSSPLCPVASILHNRIAQNFGRVNFWWLVARHVIGGEKFGESSTTGSQVHAQVSRLKLWWGKFWLA